jgi:hypothetical protein
MPPTIQAEPPAGEKVRNMATVSNSAQNGGNPPFLTPDDRIPASIRDLLLEADGCINHGFLTGGTVCAQRGVDALLKFEKADGPTFDSRVHSLGDRHSAISQLLLKVLTQLGDASSRDTSRLTSNTLHLLVVTLKAVAYEIYVVGPDRADRLQYVRRVLDATERKASASPATTTGTPSSSPAAANSSAA